MKTFDKVIGKWGYSLTPIFQWNEVFKFKEYNWVNFTPIEIQFEYGQYKGKYFQFCFIFMGIGFWFEVYDTKTREEFAKAAEELMKKYAP